MLQETLLFLLGLTFVASRRDPFYRKDYTYVDEYDAFYKLHWDLSGLSWSSAFLACDDEESSLFYPKLKDEWTVIKSLVSAMKAKPNVSDIFVGIHDEFGLGEFITVDGLPTPTTLGVNQEEPVTDGPSSCVTMDIETGSYKIDSCEAADVKPFVCKKKVVQPCPTVDTGYIYEERMKKCYKLNERKKTWTDAMQTCFLEGGILAVIKNSAEADVINERISKLNTDYYVGVRRLFPNGDFYTVTGQKFEDNFFKYWRTQMTKAGTTTDCGIVVRQLNTIYTGTMNCLQPASFLCEMAANTS